MKKLLLILTITFLFVTNSFATFVYDKGAHTFVFLDDVEVYVNMQTTNYDLDGFGYYINNDSTFYSLSEADLGQALMFNEGDRVQFVKQKDNGAKIKTTLFGNDKSVETYKIGGQGNGNIVFKLNSSKYVSGQPLPGILYTLLFSGIVLTGLARFYKIKKK